MERSAATVSSVLGSDEHGGDPQSSTQIEIPVPDVDDAPQSGADADHDGDDDSMIDGDTDDEWPIDEDDNEASSLQCSPSLPMDLQSQTGLSINAEVSNGYSSEDDNDMFDSDAEEKPTVINGYLTDDDMCPTDDENEQSALPAVGSYRSVEPSQGENSRSTQRSNSNSDQSSREYLSMKTPSSLPTSLASQDSNMGISGVTGLRIIDGAGMAEDEERGEMMDYTYADDDDDIIHSSPELEPIKTRDIWKEETQMLFD